MNKFYTSNTTHCNKTIPNAQVPTQLDWVAKGAVTGVKNQGQCGSCWAFSTTGSIQGLHFIQKKKLVSFSEQQLVDCSKSYGNQGCNGGLMNMSMWYVKDNGITYQSQYRYTGYQGKCSYTPNMFSYRINDCAQVPINSQKSLITAISNGPVSVAIQASLQFQFYKKGVFGGLCGHNLDHGVLAVGFGTLQGKKYYKVKNSWGQDWGMNGYVLMQRRGDGPGQCGIQMAATLPL